MASSLSEEEFHRLQAQFIELRSANYTLEEKCRKQNTEIELMQEKYDSLEREFQKTQKIVNKSKRAKDVEMLIQDNENLQRKLLSQEEEFQLQNATILQELSTLVSVNEKLEREINSLKDGVDSGISTSQTLAENIQFQDEIRKLKAENSALQMTLTGLRNKHEEEVELLRNSLRHLTAITDDLQVQNDNHKLTSNLKSDGCLQNSEEDDSGIIEVGEQEVIFHKCNNGSMLELFQQMEGRVKSLEKQIEENEDVKMELFREKEENKLLKQQLETLQSSTQTHSSSLQEEVARLNEKLRKKQESIIQLQSEKESLYTESRKSYEELQALKDQEIVNLKELNQRLQTQLNNSMQSFQEYREQLRKLRLNDTIEDLENEISALKTQINNESAERVDELEKEQETLRLQFAESQQRIESLTEDLNIVTVELQESKSMLEKAEAQIVTNETEITEITQALEEAKKVAEKRKNLVDEMATHLQKKSDNHQQEMVKVTEEFTKQMSKLSKELEEEKEKTEKMEEMKSQLDDLETQIKSLECTKGWFERRLNEAEMSLESTKQHYENLLQQNSEENQKKIEDLQTDYQMQITDLETQLEISNAQKTEYEETIANLKQEAKDSIEDRKIHEKKGTSIVKDLKRQLLMERKRAERLQERLQEFLNDSSQMRSVEVNAFKPPTDAGDRAETSSISSWSLMSGGQLDSTRDTQDGSGTGSSLHNGNSPTPPSVLEQENADLLCRIGALQQDKWILEEKVNHLEQSTAAMAEDMMQKQAIIQYYCMEGRTDPHHQPHFDKLTVKRVVDFIKDKGDVNQQEINRKLLRSLEETLTKNMCLQKDLEALSQELMKVNKSIESDCMTISEITSCISLPDTEQEQ